MYKNFLIFIGVVLLMISSHSRLRVRSDESGRFLTTIELIEQHGYLAEEHPDVQTSDGYLLTLHRIPHGKKYIPGERNRSVVLLMHDMMTSSSDWVTMGPEKSLGFILADNGYDVWMGNARGNRYSRKHVDYDPDYSSAFWQFSWHEIGVYDLPTIIDYILKVTKQKKLYYIGHSQGSTAFFVMGSEMQEYNEKIQLMAALAPVAYMGHIKNLFFQIMSRLNGILGWAANLLRMDEFKMDSRWFRYIGEAVCSEKSPVQKVCSNIMFLIYGWDSEQLNRTMLPIIVSNIPAGASTRQVLHYAQEIQSGRFRQYDYGFFGNMKRYPYGVPPDYNLNKTTAPVALFYAENDLLSAVDDVKRLASELPNLVQSFLVPYRKFNHIDFMYAINAKKLVYDAVLWLFHSNPID